MSGIPSLPPLASTNPATCGPPPPPPPSPPPKITGSRLEPEEKEALLSSLPFSLLMLLFLFQRQPGGFCVCRALCCAVVVVALPSRDLIRNYLAIHIFLLFATISLLLRHRRQNQLQNSLAAASSSSSSSTSTTAKPKVVCGGKEKRKETNFATFSSSSFLSPSLAARLFHLFFYSSEVSLSSRLLSLSLPSFLPLPPP